MVTRSEAASRSSESIKQQRSISKWAVKKASSIVYESRLTRIPKAEPVGGAPEGEQPTVRLDGADEPLEQLAHILLDGELLWRRQELDDKVEETLGELCDEALARDLGDPPGDGRGGGLRRWRGHGVRALRGDRHTGRGTRAGIQ